MADTETIEQPVTTAPEPKPHDRRDVDVVVSELVPKYGNERAALRVLADQQLDYRKDIRDLKSKLPKEGAVVLSPEDAKEFEAFRALGKKPKEIAALVTEHASLSTENADLKAEKVTAEAAALLEYKPSVLAKLAKTEGFRTEVRDEQDADGDPIRVPYAVVGEGDEAKATPLSEFASSALSDFLPSLTASTNGHGGKSTAPPAPAPVPAQPPRGTAPAPKHDLAAIIAEKRATGAYVA